LGISPKVVVVVVEHRRVINNEKLIKSFDLDHPRRYAPRVFNQPEGQSSSRFEPPPWAGQPAPPANPGQESGAPGDPAYPTYQRPNAPDNSRDRHSGEATSVVGLWLTLVGLAGAFTAWLAWLPLVPALILMTIALLLAVVGAILVGRAVARRLGRLRDIVGLLAAGAAAVISVPSLLAMTDPTERDYYTCWHKADTLEQQNACDVSYNTAVWEADR
jgi:hypothetical protein